MPQKTAEEKAALKSLLSQEKENFDLIRTETQNETKRWQREIATLERRVREESEDVDLGNGDLIAVRTCLSNAESQKIAALEEERASLSPESDSVRLDEIAYEILEIMTANPLLTAAWFRENPDKFAVSDMVRLTIGFYRARVAMKSRGVRNAASFRREPAGPELRGVSEVSRNPGPA
jgi:hypothetical protein